MTLSTVLAIVPHFGKEVWVINQATRKKKKDE